MNSPIFTAEARRACVLRLQWPSLALNYYPSWALGPGFWPSDRVSNKAVGTVIFSGSGDLTGLSASA